MTSSIVTLLLALVPVAGTLIIMNWALRDSERQSKHTMFPKHDTDAKRIPEAFSSSDDNRKNSASIETTDHSRSSRVKWSDANPMTGNVTKAALFMAGTIVTGASMIALISGAYAHEIPWRAGETRQVDFASCSKGACMKRTCWSNSRPHRHINGKVVMDTQWNTSCERQVR